MFLGVILHSQLTWAYHIQHVKIKIAKNIGILCRARKILKTITLITLYYAFIYPYLTYCVEVWGSAAKVYITSVEKVQKLACRIITSMPPRTSFALLFTMLNFLTFNARGRSHKVGPAAKVGPCPFAVVNNGTVTFSLLVLSGMPEGTNERYQNTSNAI